MISIFMHNKSLLFIGNKKKHKIEKIILFNNYIMELNLKQ